MLETHREKRRNISSLSSLLQRITYHSTELVRSVLADTRANLGSNRYLFVLGLSVISLNQHHVWLIDNWNVWRRAVIATVFNLSAV